MEHQKPGRKSWGECFQTVERQRENPERSKKQPTIHKHLKASHILQNLESHINAQVRTYAMRPENTLNFHLWLISRLKTSRE